MKCLRTIEVPDCTYYVIGDRIGFTLDGGEYMEAIAVKDEEDGMLFCAVDCLAKERPMMHDGNDGKTYEESDLRKELNDEILRLFPDEIREKMVPFANGDLLRVPTEKEIFGVNEYGKEEPDTVTRWKPMQLRRNRIAFQGHNGTVEWYWLQNTLRDPASASNFATVTTRGACDYSDASLAWVGVRPAFKIRQS